ncbi:MAG TPA: hypothetical protein VGC97_00675 [Pyrinomonadaceae bacterium]|jgi:hypothetical protein
MAEKKEKSAKTKIEIQTRKPERRGIFDNLGSDRSTNDHPLREILNFPSDKDIQASNLELSKPQTSGYPKTDNLDN